MRQAVETMRERQPHLNMRHENTVYEKNICEEYKKSKLYYDRRSVGQSALVQSHYLGTDRLCLLFHENYLKTFTIILLPLNRSDERAGL
jgi:hypothetical protein